MDHQEELTLLAGGISDSLSNCKTLEDLFCAYGSIQKAWAKLKAEFLRNFINYFKENGGLAHFEERAKEIKVYLARFLPCPVQCIVYFLESSHMNELDASPSSTHLLTQYGIDPGLVSHYYPDGITSWNKLRQQAHHTVNKRFRHFQKCIQQAEMMTTSVDDIVARQSFAIYQENSSLEDNENDTMISVHQNAPSMTGSSLTNSGDSHHVSLADISAAYAIPAAVLASSSLSNTLPAIGNQDAASSSAPNSNPLDTVFNAPPLHAAELSGSTSSTSPSSASSSSTTTIGASGSSSSVSNTSAPAAPVVTAAAIEQLLHSMEGKSDADIIKATKKLVNPQRRQKQTGERRACLYIVVRPDYSRSFAKALQQTGLISHAVQSILQLLSGDGDDTGDDSNADHEDDNGDDSNNDDPEDGARAARKQSLMLENAILNSLAGQFEEFKAGMYTNTGSIVEVKKACEESCRRRYATPFATGISVEVYPVNGSPELVYYRERMFFHDTSVPKSVLPYSPKNRTRAGEVYICRNDDYASVLKRLQECAEWYVTHNVLYVLSRL